MNRDHDRTGFEFRTGFELAEGSSASQIASGDGVSSNWTGATVTCLMTLCWGGGGGLSRKAAEICALIRKHTPWEKTLSWGEAHGARAQRGGAATQV